MLEEPQADYEKAEMDLLKSALKRTYMERLLFATTLREQASENINP